MSEQIYPGPSQMVKIDGSKVRNLREAKGLTQLYIATVVGVTTDTISRWENKRYPSIKEENALKLAEALEVTLDDILEKEDEVIKPEDTGTSHKTQSKSKHCNEGTALMAIPRRYIRHCRMRAIGDTGTTRHLISDKTLLRNLRPCTV